MEERKYRIGEAAKMLNLKTYVLRFWETEFPQLDPHRTDKGQRLYSEKDITLLRTIRHLLHERGLTIEGARKALDEHISMIMQDSGGENSPSESASSGERIGASFTASALSAFSGSGSSGNHSADSPNMNDMHIGNDGNPPPCDPATIFTNGTLPPEADTRLGPVQGLLYDVAQAARSAQSVESARHSHNREEQGSARSGAESSSIQGKRMIPAATYRSVEDSAAGHDSRGIQPSGPDTALLKDVISELEELRNLLVEERQKK